MPEQLILASRSPQRRAILEQLGIGFRVEAPGVEEAREGEPRDLVIENALRKARSVSGEFVLGVDTVVVLDGRASGKAETAYEAETLLNRLSGRTHEVWSGLALKQGSEERTDVATTRVRFRRLDHRELHWYLDSGEWEGRAGAYAIQGRGAALVEEIEGDYTNVVGLPVATLLKLAPELLVPAATAET